MSVALVENSATAIRVENHRGLFNLDLTNGGVISDMRIGAGLPSAWNLAASSQSNVVSIRASGVDRATLGFSSANFTASVVDLSPVRVEITLTWDFDAEFPSDPELTDLVLTEKIVVTAHQVYAKLSFVRTSVAALDNLKFTFSVSELAGVGSFNWQYRTDAVDWTDVPTTAADVAYDRWMQQRNSDDPVGAPARIYVGLGQFRDGGRLLAVDRLFKNFRVRLNTGTGLLINVLEADAADGWAYTGTTVEADMCLFCQTANPGAEDAGSPIDGTDEFAEVMNDFADPQNFLSSSAVSVGQPVAAGWSTTELGYHVLATLANEVELFWDRARPHQSIFPPPPRPYKFPTLVIDDWTSSKPPIIRQDGSYLTPDDGSSVDDGVVELLRANYTSVVDTVNQRALVQWVSGTFDTVWFLAVEGAAGLQAAGVLAAEEPSTVPLGLEVRARGVGSSSTTESSLVDLRLNPTGFVPKIFVLSLDGGETVGPPQDFVRDLLGVDLNSPSRGFKSSMVPTASNVAVWRFNELGGRELANGLEDPSDFVLTAPFEGEGERYWTRRGRVGPCVVFHVEHRTPRVNTAPIVTLDLTGVTAATVLGWAAPELADDTTTSEQILLGTGGQFVKVTVTDDKKIRGTVYTSGADSDFETDDPVPDIVFGQFFHWALAIDLAATPQIRVYVNGAERAISATPTAGAVFSSIDPFFELGASSDHAGGFAGRKDELLVVLETAFSSSEVHGQFVGVKMTTLPFASFQKQVLWRFNEGYGVRTRAERRGSNWRITSGEPDPVRDTDDFYFGRASLDFSSAFTARIFQLDNNHTNFDGASEFTFMAVIKPRSAGTGAARLLDKAAGGNTAISIRLTSTDEIQVSIDTTGGLVQLVSTSSPFIGFRDEWFVLCFRYNNTTQDHKILGAYVTDPTLQTLATSSAAGTLVDTDGNSASLGSQAAGLERFDGHVDEILWAVGQALTDSEFQAVFEQIRVKAGSREIVAVALGANDEIVRGELLFPLQYLGDVEVEDVVVRDTTVVRALEGPQLVVSWSLPESNDVAEVVVVRRARDWSRSLPSAAAEVVIDDLAIWDGSQARFGNVSWHFPSSPQVQPKIFPNPDLNFVGARRFTYMGWVYIETQPGTGSGRSILWSKGNTGDSSNGRGPAISLEDVGGTDVRMRVDVRGVGEVSTGDQQSGGFGSLLGLAGNDPKNQWIFLAVTFDKDHPDGSDYVNIYGAVPGRPLTNLGLGSLDVVSANPILDDKGPWTFGNLDGGGGRFGGYMDETQIIIDRRLTSDELAAAYDLGRGRLRATRERRQLLLKMEEYGASFSRNHAIDAGGEMLLAGPLSLGQAGVGDVGVSDGAFYYYTVWSRRASDDTWHSSPIAEAAALAVATDMRARLWQRVPSIHQNHDVTNNPQALVETALPGGSGEVAALGEDGTVPRGELERFLHTSFHMFGEMEGLTRALYKVVDDPDQTHVDVLPLMGRILGINLERFSDGELRRHLLRHAVDFFKLKGRPELIDWIFRRFYDTATVRTRFGRDAVFVMDDLDSFTLPVRRVSVTDDGDFSVQTFVDRARIEPGITSLWEYSEETLISGVLQDVVGRRNDLELDRPDSFRIARGYNPRVKTMEGLGKGAHATIRDADAVGLDMPTDFTIGVVGFLAVDDDITTGLVTLAGKFTDASGSEAGYRLQYNAAADTIRFIYYPDGSSVLQTLASVAVERGKSYFCGVRFEAGATSHVFAHEIGTLNFLTGSGAADAAGLGSTTTQFESQLSRAGIRVRAHTLFVADRAFSLDELENFLRPSRWRPDVPTFIGVGSDTRWPATADSQLGVELSALQNSQISQRLRVQPNTPYLVEVRYLYLDAGALDEDVTITLDGAASLLNAVLPRPAGAGVEQLVFRQLVTTANADNILTLAITQDGIPANDGCVISSVRVVEFAEPVLNFPNTAGLIGTFDDRLKRLPGRRPDHIISFGSIVFRLPFDGSASLKLVDTEGRLRDAVPALYEHSVVVEDREAGF